MADTERQESDTPDPADDAAAPPEHSDSGKDDARQAPKPTPGPRQPGGEINGPKGPEPTRYNDWERGGRVSDF